MPAIDVVSDANLVLKWFHSDGEEEVDEARELLDAHRARRISLAILELTPYEVGNALLRGRAEARPEQVATVLDALSEICQDLRPTRQEFRLAAGIADEHRLTIYDAIYAAVARARGAILVTLDRELLRAGLGIRPSEFAGLER
jgi:predicted nucleic acid-binding protein